MEQTDWRGLYGESWSGDIVPKAISHPAKFSRALIRHIYKHAIEEGWLSKGDCVLDPFAGVALGAADAMRHGMHWRGVELEQRFVDLGQQNIEFWNKRYGKHVDDWGTAQIVQGDSRSLLNIVNGADGVVSSPPFGKQADKRKVFPDYIHKNVLNTPGRVNQGYQNQADSEDNLSTLPMDNGYDAAISSPPFLAQSGGTNVTSKQGPLSDERLLKRHSAGNAATDAYGDDPKNLGNLPEGEYDAAISSPPYSKALRRNVDQPSESDRQHRIDIGRDPDSPGSFNLHNYSLNPDNLGNLPDKGYDAAISSPPFAESNPDGGWQLLGKYAEEGRLTVKQVKGDPNKSYPSWDKERETPYAISEENLGNMKDQGFDAAISSPPYAETEVSTAKKHSDKDERIQLRENGTWQGYNKQNPANLGNLKDEESDEEETFWTAARKIIEQTYAALKPGGMAIWVTKAFVKKGERVDFPGQWRAVCEAVGFVTLHEHKAWVIEDKGAQYDIFGNLVQQKIERKSFFRRLAEKKGAPRIDYEVVTCMRKENNNVSTPELGRNESGA